MNLQQLEASFEQEYKPKLEALDQLRKGALKMMLIGILIGPASTLLAVYIAAMMNQDIRFGVVFGFFVCLFLYWIFKDRWGLYRTSYKEHVVGSLLETMYPSLSYRQCESVSSNHYRTSGLYTKSYDKYEGEDLISGRIGKTAIEFSELHTSYKTETRDSKGNRHTSWHTIFKGVFFVADFNKHFHGKLFVVPDGQGLFNSIGKLFTEFSGGMGARVALENPVFEQYFEVYGSDQVEARYILSPAFMEHLVSFYERCGNQIRLSFINENLFIAIASRKDHFEPRLFSSAASFEVVQSIFLDLKFLTDIVEELELNTRIWTKD